MSKNLIPPYRGVRESFTDRRSILCLLPLYHTPILHSKCLPVQNNNHTVVLESKQVPLPTNTPRLHKGQQKGNTPVGKLNTLPCPRDACGFAVSRHTKAERRLAASCRDLAQHGVSRTQKRFLLLLSVPADEGSPLSHSSGQTDPSLLPAELQVGRALKVLVQKSKLPLLLQGTKQRGGPPQSCSSTATCSTYCVAEPRPTRTGEDRGA